MSKGSFKVIVNGDPVKGAVKGSIESAIKTAISVANVAKELAPKDTTRLTNSIMWKSSNSSGLFNAEDGSAPLESKPKTGEVLVGTNVKYGTYQEFGTQRMMARPYLRPAAKVANGGTLQQAIKEANVLAMKSVLR